MVIDELSFKAPKTREVQRILHNVGIERSALIVTGQPDRTVLASARNIQKTKVLPAAYLNVVDMLNHRHLLMTEEAIKVAEDLWGRKRSAGRPAGGMRPSRAAEPAPAAEAPSRRARAKAEGATESRRGGRSAGRGRRRSAEAERARRRRRPKPKPRKAAPAERRSRSADPCRQACRREARPIASHRREGAGKEGGTAEEGPPRAKADASADAPKPRPRARKPKATE